MFNRNETMKFRNNKSLIILITCASLLAGCNTYAPITDSSFRYLYDYESSSLHPEYVVYHKTEDSTSIHFRVHSSELLYTRSGSDQPFRSSLMLKCKRNDIVLDSIMVEDEKNPENERWLTGEFQLPIAAGSSFNITMELMDNKRQIGQETRLFLDKRDRYNQQNFLLRELNTNAIIFKEFLPAEHSFVILSARNDGNSFHVFHDPESVKLPPPPFSSNPPELPGVSELSEIPLGTMAQEKSAFSLHLKSGRYVICAGDERKLGKTITVADKFFPEVGSVRELIHPLRYITSKVEYETIETNSDPKKLIDNFWIECAGNKDRARELIRIYYNRVREANYYFSGFTEGWRTDRGMVHLIFGHPNVIRKTDDGESWIYGEEGNISSITFVFKKSNYGLAGNVFTLIRDPMFRTHWERMVTTWRNGRVYNE
jgi:GWxTD domain-containing protein